MPASNEQDAETIARVLADPVAFLGNGIVLPFQRDQKNDYAHRSGAEAVASSLRNILGTKGPTSSGAQGELRWRTTFGAALHTLRHQNNDEVLAELARIRVMEAVTRWEPRANVRDVAATALDSDFGPRTILSLVVLYDVIDTNMSSNRVILPNQRLSLNVPMAA